MVFLVGLSRMYLGAHFPLDVVGGWALGAFIGSAISLAIGVSSNGLSLARLRTFLSRRGYDIKNLKFASVDARGSRPLFMTLKNGDHYFGKVFGTQEHAADWLFKMFRFFRYKNLQAEEPYMNRRRNVEMESFAMLWAKQAGVRVPKVIDLLNFGASWVLLQEKIDAKPMSEHHHILQKSLVDAWKQVAKLHAANIAHRDLRAANLMVDKKGSVWIIDFGFAEVSARAQRQYMDIAELLMSMSLVVGTQRTVEAAMKVIDPVHLKRALPYLQKAVFSGATTKQLRQDKKILNMLRDELKENLGIKKDIETADIVRINNRRALSITLMAVFIYIVAPQFSSFKNAIGSTQVTEPQWLIPLAIASMMTYVFTGAVYVSLAQVPLKIRQAALVQLAASFMSKILPGGIGPTSLNARYLTRSGMDVTDTSAVIATQGVIGFVMFIVPLTLFLFVNGQSISQLLHIKLHVKYIILTLIILTLVTVATALIPKLRRLVSKKLLNLIESIRNIATPGRELVLANIASLAVTVAYLICLYASLKAFGLSLPVGTIIFVYAAAVIARNAIPTPGGLGPLEAAMIGTLVALGVGKEQALSAVLLYRLATFWLPIPFSAAAYKYINAKRII
jgi:undecaprenyl-diphosphatase